MDGFCHDGFDQHWPSLRSREKDRVPVPPTSNSTGAGAATLSLKSISAMFSDGGDSAERGRGAAAPKHDHSRDSCQQHQTGHSSVAACGRVGHNGGDFGGGRLNSSQTTSVSRSHSESASKPISMNKCVLSRIASRASVPEPCKLLPCGHVWSVPYVSGAWSSVPECMAPCARTLVCGHKCMLPCATPCDNSLCQMPVTVMKNCGHELTVKCFEQHYLDSVQCNYQGLKRWPYCGHLNEAECHVDVYEVACPHACGQPLPDCEHLCVGNCGTCKQGRLHMKCQEDCRRVMVCGHECAHKCGGGTGCPPCTARCEARCVHRRCASHHQRPRYRTCGELCPPCLQPCDCNCKHQQCELTCSEPCTRPVCEERCGTELECGEGHMCAGVCNGTHSLHNCPTVTIKNKKKWAEVTEIFLGTEDVDNAAFIQLDDCDCIMEFSGLDGYMQSKADDTNGEIVQLKCPRCQTAVRSSRRFGALLKQRVIDIEQVKDKIIGDGRAHLKVQQDAFCVRIRKMLKETVLLQPCHWADTVEVRRGRKRIVLQERAQVTKHNADRVSMLKAAFEGLLVSAESTVPAQLTAALQSHWDTVFNLLLHCLQCRAFDLRVCAVADCEERSNVERMDIEHLLEPSTNWSTHTPNLFAVWSEFTNLSKLSPPQSVVQDIWWLIDWIDTRTQHKMANSQMQQINNMLNQIEFLTVLASACSKSVLVRHDIKPSQCEALKHLLTPLYSAELLTQHTQTQLRRQLDLFMGGLKQPASSVQLRQIARALGFDTGHWFKCDHCGEMYAIANCGKPMQRSQCAKCKAAIGGQDYKLCSYNSCADELMCGK